MQQSSRHYGDFLSWRLHLEPGFLIAAEMLTAQVVSARWGAPLYNQQLRNGPRRLHWAAAGRTATCPHFSREPPLRGVASPLLRQPTKVMTVNINCGDGLPNSAQRGYYTAVRLQQNVATTHLGWFELMT